MGNNLQFKGVTDIGQVGFTNQLSNNVSAFLDWALLGIGGFFNVGVALSGHYGGDQSQLRRVSDPNHMDGCVYEAFRNNWVWESGISYEIQPIAYSGVYINNNFYEVSTTGVYSHKVNYPMGQIIFDNPLDVSDKVQTSFSHKQVLVTTSEVPWSRTILFDSMRVDSPMFLQQGSGVWNILSQSRVQLPVILIDPITDVNFRGAGLGGGQYREQSLMIYVIAEDPSTRNNLMDILLNQSEKTIILYDVNKPILDNRFPLDFDGYLQPSGYQYPDMVANYANRRCTILKADALDIFEDKNLYRAAIKWQCEVEVNNI